MPSNPRDWRIENLKAVARKFSIRYRQQGTSHVVIHEPAGLLCVPCARPIKPIYIRQFVALVGKIGWQDWLTRLNDKLVRNEQRR